jgi:hypothetical protein
MEKGTASNRMGFWRSWEVYVGYRCLKTDSAHQTAFAARGTLSSAGQSIERGTAGSVVSTGEDHSRGEKRRDECERRDRHWRWFPIQLWPRTVHRHGHTSGH